jgi:hypothetical protein
MFGGATPQKAGHGGLEREGPLLEPTTHFFFFPVNESTEIETDDGPIL